MKPLLTIAEVAQVLRVDQTTVRRWITRGALDAVSLPRLGNRHSHRIHQSTLDHILGSSVTTSTVSRDQNHLHL